MGVVNFEPLKEFFLALYACSTSKVSGHPLLAPLTPAVHRNPDKSDRPQQVLPCVVFSLESLRARLEEALNLTTGGKFLDALQGFRQVLCQSLVTLVDTMEESDDVQGILGKCREYILGLSMELARRELDPSLVGRSVEMATYFTHCGLDGAHLQLALRSAMAAAYKVKNYATAYALSTRLLELSPPPQLGQLAKKIQVHCEKFTTDEIPLEYDRYSPFVICGQSFKLIYRGSPCLTCPTCGGSFVPEAQGRICSLCQMGRVGSTQGTGLVNRSSS